MTVLHSGCRSEPTGAGAPAVNARPAHAGARPPTRARTSAAWIQKCLDLPPFASGCKSTRSLARTPDPTSAGSARAATGALARGARRCHDLGDHLSVCKAILVHEVGDLQRAEIDVQRTDRVIVRIHVRHAVAPPGWSFSSSIQGRRRSRYCQAPNDAGEDRRSARAATAALAPRARCRHDLGDHVGVCKALLVHEVGDLQRPEIDVQCIDRSIMRMQIWHISTP
jgi:hypothetical protein